MSTTAACAASVVHADANKILGLTHPAHAIRACALLHKKRTKHIIPFKTVEWAPRLFVLTDNALQWFDVNHGHHGNAHHGPIGHQTGRVDIKHIVSLQASKRNAHASTADRDDLERHGPRHQLEIATISADSTLTFGSHDDAEVTDWLACLSKAVGRVGARFNQTPRRDSLDAVAIADSPTLRLDLTGLVAVGTLQKARSALEKTVRDSKKDGWSTRLVVLTKTHLYYYKPRKEDPHADDGSALGLPFRGESIFGYERGRMPLVNASIHSECVVEDSVEYTHITLTASISGFDADSLFNKSVSKLASIGGEKFNSDRYRAVLRTHDAQLAAEWVAMLRSTCGAQRASVMGSLEQAIANGDTHGAAEIAAEMAHLASKVPHVSARKAELAAPQTPTSMSDSDAEEYAVHPPLTSRTSHAITALHSARDSFLHISQVALTMRDKVGQAADPALAAAMLDGALLTISEQCKTAAAAADNPYTPVKAGISRTDSPAPVVGSAPAPGGGAAASAHSTERLRRNGGHSSPKSERTDAGSMGPHGFNLVTGKGEPWASAGDGTYFDLRMHDYKKHKKKAPSAPHVYELAAADVFRRTKILHHVTSHVNLPPLDDADEANDTGLPRSFVLNVAIPAGAPSLMGNPDGDCYQLVLYFRATAAALREWVATGSAGVRLFRRFVSEAAHSADIKERFKLLVKMENLKQLGKLGSQLEGYNGKPALITKSGSLFQGADYLEMGMNTFRFAFITRKGMNYFIPKLPELRIHAAVTIEGRDNDELPEQCLAAGRIFPLDLQKLASAVNES